MFILSHDQKLLVDVRLFRIEKNFGSKNNKYALIGISAADDTFPVTLAFYSTEEEAMAEISSIYAAIETGKTVYSIAQ